MTILVTGSSGHLGEALMRTLRERAVPAIGLDKIAGEFTDAVGSIADRALVRRCMKDARTVLHAATLHKPHVGTHAREEFIETNVRGALVLLEEAVASGVEAFVFTSTTSAFGDALVPPPGAPAAWITEAAPSIPKNIYGVTKTAAEDLCQLFHRNEGLACVVLRTARFFPEEDDSEDVRASFAPDNAKTNEYLYRRVDIEDVVSAHLAAAERAPRLGFGKYIVSATTPFTSEDLPLLRADAPAAVLARVPEYAAQYAERGWRMFPSVDRVYVNAKARRDLGWAPQWDFRRLIGQLANGEAPGSELARLVGAKGYHPEPFAKGPYPLNARR
ncbi:MAG: NAD(P)-dependent oxidoreductase [Hyphomicrobiales bacterium]|nr:NAD(P)-dependent oxidoreductase [Hyphomicrobiales bacterium]